MDSSAAEFTRFWTAALPKVSAFVGSLVHNIEDRDDVLQDCAVAAMTSYSSFDQDRSFDAWVIGVARNQVRLYLRRRTRDPLPFDDEALDALVVAFASTEPCIEKNLTKLDHCVDKLEPKARELCELRYARELKPSAIAEILGMTPNTISKSLQRIREQLRQCLEKSAPHQL